MAAGNSQGHTQAAILKAWLYIDQGFIKPDRVLDLALALSKMHGKSTDPACRSDMGGGTDRAGRGAARSWERQRTTGTALAAGLLVLGTLLVIRGHRWDTDVADGKADRPAPDAADAAAGCSAHTVNPVGGEENRHIVLPLLSRRAQHQCASWGYSGALCLARILYQYLGPQIEEGVAPGALCEDVRNVLA